MAAVNYVKFYRGTPQAYNALVIKDKDALYFIAETNAVSGKLYLGDKLISGEATADSLNVTFEQLADVSINNETLALGDVLSYNGTKWVNRAVSDLFSENDVFVGATAEADGMIGLVPAPKKEDINKFLSATGTWVNPLVNLDDTISAKVAELLIPENASESLDTLQEIGAWIQSHPNDVTAINKELKDLSDVVFDKTGNVIDPETNEEVTIVLQKGLESRVADIETQLNELTSNSYVTATEVNNMIDAKMAWQEL